MKTIEIIGYKRANLGKSDSKRLRADSNVPCVLYGGKEQVHFHAPAILFRELVYTDMAHFVLLNIEGTEYLALLQDIQFHPVSEIIIHADFLQMFEDKPIKMNIPVHFHGVSPGVINGGTLIKKRRNLRVQALPKNMPEFIDVDISTLDFHKAIKVGEIETGDYNILDTAIASVAVVEVPRALRGKTGDVEGDAEGADEGAEEAAAEE